MFLRPDVAYIPLQNQPHETIIIKQQLYYKQ